MDVDGKPSISMPPPESAFGHAVTVTSKCNPFISVLNCTKVVNLVKFEQVFYKVLC